MTYEKNLDQTPVQVEGLDGPTPIFFEVGLCERKNQSCSTFKKTSNGAPCVLDDPPKKYKVGNRLGRVAAPGLRPARPRSESVAGR